VTSSLGAVPKGLCDIRFIHDLSRPEGGVNALSLDTTVSYVTIDEATYHLLPTSFLSKIDLKNAYRNIPIHPHDFEQHRFVVEIYR
jgi:hypothetical protein